MRRKTIWARLASVEGARVLDVRVEENGDGVEVVVAVSVFRHESSRCGECGKRCPGYDGGDGPRRWRSLDLGTVRVSVEADAPRVRCAEHGVIAARVPWARHGSWFTRAFEDQVAWLAVHTDRTTVSALARIAWRTVGRILGRVSDEGIARTDRLAKLRRIGIDEISYKKGHKYITVVLDHDTGRLLWARPGRDEATVRAFFDELGAERSAKLELVSADAAVWIANVVRERCPRARLCMDPFHVVSWATKALDEVRRTLWQDLRRAGKKLLAAALKGLRWAIVKNPDNLTSQQELKLADLERTNRPLYRAYLLKEKLRAILYDHPDFAPTLLDDWIRMARRSRILPFVKLADTILSNREAIIAALDAELSNARVESANTKIRLLTRMAFGFHSPHALISLALLRLGGFCPPLPGRA
jgi:transposase